MIQINRKYKKRIESELRRVEKSTGSNTTYDMVTTALGKYLALFDPSLLNNALNGLTVVFSSFRASDAKKKSKKKANNEATLLTCKYENQAWYLVDAKLGKPKTNTITCEKMDNNVIESVLWNTFHYRYKPI